jgi:acyl-CoA reductase-like NAD-dependent aldehyde dehydrogenase
MKNNQLKGGKRMSRTIEAIMRHMVPPAKREPARKASGMEASMNFESRNPATGELIGVYPEHSKAEIEIRLQRAWDGWLYWSRTPMQERIAFLTRLAELLEERVETYGRLITAEMGKPLADSIFEIKKSAWAARHLAEVGEAYLKPQPIPGVTAEIIYESGHSLF